MLTQLRGATGGIIAKTFLVLLAGSFAVWGVADVFRGRSDQTLVTIGGQEISARQFRAYFDSKLRDLSRLTGQGLTVEMARKAGLDRQILGELVRFGVLDELTRQLKMSIPDEFVARQLAKDPRFRGVTGSFEASRIQQMLAQRGISEAQFIEDERRKLIRAAITGTLQQGLEAPRTLVEIAIRQANEQRDVQYFTVTAKGITVDEPDEKQLRAFYDSNKSRFAVPERRGFDIITVKAEELAKNTPVSEDKLKALYEKRKLSFDVPEKRTIEQIPFNTQKEADEARKKIAAGMSFEELAKQRKLSEKDRLLGSFTKPEVPDSAIADAAFALNLNEVSEPVKGKLSFYLVRVTKIKPAVTKTYQQVRDELLKIFRAETGRDLILDLRDKVEDARGAGTSFAEIAKTMKLDYRSLPPVDIRGLDKDGKEITGVTSWADVRKVGFETEPGLETDPIATPDDGFVWISVREVVPAHVQKFEEVKDKVAELWKRRQIRKKVLELAKQLKEKAESGTDFEELAKQTNGQIKTLRGIKRNEANSDFGTQAVRAVFSTAPDGYAVAIGGDGKSALVIKSTPVLMPPVDPNSPDAKKMAGALANYIRQDVLASYVAKLQSEIKVEINNKAWATVFQTTSGQ